MLDFLDLGLDLGDIRLVKSEFGSGDFVFALEVRRLENSEFLPLLWLSWSDGESSPDS